MHVAIPRPREAMEPIDFRTEPARYRHWKIEIDAAPAPASSPARPEPAAAAKTAKTAKSAEKVTA